MSQYSAFAVGGLEIEGESMNNTRIKIKTVNDERTARTSLYSA